MHNVSVAMDHVGGGVGWLVGFRGREVEGWRDRGEDVRSVNILLDHNIGQVAKQTKGVIIKKAKAKGGCRCTWLCPPEHCLRVLLGNHKVAALHQAPSMTQNRSYMHGPVIR